MFTPEVIDEHYGLTRDNIILVPGTIYGLNGSNANGWQEEVGEEFEYNKLPRSFQMLMKFICHSMEPTLHMSTFNFAKAKLLFHLAWGLKIDLETFIHNQIVEFSSAPQLNQNMIFPSLICCICLSTRVWLLPVEQPTPPNDAVNR